MDIAFLLLYGANSANHPGVIDYGSQVDLGNVLARYEKGRKDVSLQFLSEYYPDASLFASFLFAGAPARDLHLAGENANKRLAATNKLFYQLSQARDKSRANGLDSLNRGVRLVEERLSHICY